MSEVVDSNSGVLTRFTMPWEDLKLQGNHGTPRGNMSDMKCFEFGFFRQGCGLFQSPFSSFIQRGRRKFEITQH